MKTLALPYTPPRPASGERGWVVSAGILGALVLAPVLTLVVLALRGSGELWPHLARYVLPDALQQTAVLFAGVAVLTGVLGVATAWLVSACRFRGRRALQWALLLPLAMPTYIVAYAYVDLLHPLGPVQGALRWMLGLAPGALWFPSVRSMGGCVLLFGFVLYPYVYLSTRAMFLMQSACVLEVARTLGLGPAKTFFRVALPLAYPAIAVGVSLALMEAMNDVGAAEFLGVRTLTVSIYSTWVNRSSLEGAAQIALFMLGIVVALVLLERWARRRQRYAVAARRNRGAAPVRLTGWRAAGAVAFCAMPVLVGFLAPALYLAYASAERLLIRGVIPANLVWEAWNSVRLAGAATLVTVSGGLVLAYAIRLVRGPLPHVLARIASLGYALPGTVLAVGLLTPLAAVDNAFDALMRATAGVSPGLVLSGSGFALIYAYAVRFLAVATGGIESGLGKIAPNLDAAARNLGEPASGVLWRVHLPLLRPALGAAAVLVFVDAMKELSATLLLRPFNFETLATHVYAEAARGTYEDGALAAMLIVLVGLVPVALLARATRVPFVNGAGRVKGGIKKV